MMRIVIWDFVDSHVLIGLIQLRMWTSCGMRGFRLPQWFNPLALELDIYSLAHHLCKSEYFMNQEG